MVSGVAAVGVPEEWEALLRPLASLRGVSKREAGLLPKLVGGGRVLDLLFHLPVSLVDRGASPFLDEAVPGAIVTVVVEVIRHVKPGTARQPWRVVVRDGSGEMDLTLFQPQRLHQLPVGERVAVSGRVDRYGERLRMTHPDFVVPAERRDEIPRLEPVWPLCAGLGPSSLRRAVAGALAVLPEGLAEWALPALLEREGWPGFADAIRTLQAPQEDDAVARGRSHARLAYDELLAGQVAVGLMRARVRDEPGRALVGDGRLRAEALRRFGFAPTASQAQALEEIDADLAAPQRMLRLLQGDVGAGKTLVALLAMLRAAEAGVQAALMAPTELLARQHVRTFERLAAPSGVVLLVGGMGKKARREALGLLASGAAKLAIGTHALFSEDVLFHDLGLAVIDEQHRFGVGQRLELGRKGEAVDVLVMTATPIPRTLLLAKWGEMAVSRIEGKPAGRKPIRTTVHPISALDEVVGAVIRAVAGGAQVFWVCPLVSESETSDLAAAEARFAALRGRFGDEAVGLAHGRQESAEREAALGAFAGGRTRVLVATTVIEVGVDVPSASVMVVEHAERFGLAQLHQLRGRVGRGAAESFCLLLHDEDGSGKTAKQRLATLKATEDGFVIADEDFRLRGAGDALGLRQSGHPGFRLALEDGVERLLEMARRDAELLLERDSGLVGERGVAVRGLLACFGYEDGARLLGAG
jgi:ATP-dependent DNA helicase RecG